MFPEYRDLITSLKTTDLHFTRLFDQHNELDQKIQNMEDGIEMATPVEIDTLKREKLQLKDEGRAHPGYGANPTQSFKDRGMAMVAALRHHAEEHHAARNTLQHIAPVFRAHDRRGHRHKPALATS